MPTGMDNLGAAIADGRAGFGESLDTLMSAHIRLFGTPATPGGLYRLENRISERLMGATEKFTDKDIREWSQPRLIPVEKDRTGLER